MLGVRKIIIINFNGHRISLVAGTFRSIKDSISTEININFFLIFASTLWTAGNNGRWPFSNENILPGLPCIFSKLKIEATNRAAEYLHWQGSNFFGSSICNVLSIWGGMEALFCGIYSKGTKRRTGPKTPHVGKQSAETWLVENSQNNIAPHHRLPYKMQWMRSTISNFAWTFLKVARKFNPMFATAAIRWCQWHSRRPISGNYCVMAREQNMFPECISN